MTEKQLKFYDRMLIVCFGIVIIIAISGMAIWIHGKVNAMVQEVPVTQEQCAYPVRPLNPDGTCDNSDPCDPTRIKIDGGKCVDEPTPEPVKEETGTPINRFSDPEYAEATQCGK